jgi:hypothetical protein
MYAFSRIWFSRITKLIFRIDAKYLPLFSVLSTCGRFSWVAATYGK